MYCFCMQKLKNLGHIVIPSGGKVDPDKTKAIDKCELPTNIKELQMLLGICCYYAKLVL